MFVHMAMSVFVAVGMAMRLRSMSMFMGMHMPMRMRMRMLVLVIAVISSSRCLTRSFSDRPNMAPVAAEAKKEVGSRSLVHVCVDPWVSKSCATRIRSYRTPVYVGDRRIWSAVVDRTRY
jgi:hypothetical protein